MPRNCALLMRLAVTLLTLAIILPSNLLAQGQPLAKRQAYDKVILKNKEEHLVEPLPIPGRVMPARRPRGKLQMRVLEDPDEEYEVNWAEIDRIVFYEEILLFEARQFTDQGKFDEAFEHFAFILAKYPRTRGVQPEINRYLFLNSGKWYSENPPRLFEGLSVLEELYGRNPKYQYTEGATVVAALDSVANDIVKKYIGEKKYEKTQLFILDLRKRFPNEKLTASANGIRELDRLAAVLRDETRALLDAGKLREAQQRSRQMLKIWPEVSGGKQLIAEIDSRYPLFYVGVAQKSAFSDRNRIDNWAARRTGYLTGRNIMEFSGSGPEFGKYSCPLGTALQSYDRRTLTIVLDAKKQQLNVTGRDLARQFLSLSDPKSKSYDSAWASLMKSVEVKEVFRLDLHLHRPNVRPESLLQIDISGTFSSFLKGKTVGPFVPAPDDPNQKKQFESVRFVANSASPFRQQVIPGVTPPAEIVERTFNDNYAAIAALRSGEIDVVDFVMPSEVERLKLDTSIVVVPYALPSVHMLIPNYEKPFTKSEMFRRAMVYGLRRELILNELILRNQAAVGSQVISGPFSISVSEIDPSGYAYDESLRPRKFDPRTALTLVKLTEQRAKNIAEKKGEKPPKLPTMILAHPADELSRFICQAIQFQWNAIPDTGVKCELKELPPGRTFDSKKEYDYLYARVAMWEPLRDARRLLAPGNLTGVTDDHVNRALQSLDKAGTEKELRERVQELHRITHQSVTVVPLWQTIDYFAHSRRVRRRIKSPLSLYQDILSWQLVAPQALDAMTSR